VWEPYLEREKLLPNAADVQRAIQQLDAHLRQRGSTYPRWIGAHRLTQEEFLPEIRFELAMRRLADRTLAQLRPEEVKAEFDAHPDWYDGSRIRISEILLDTRDLANDPEKLEKAKQRIEKIHEHLRNGKDFGALASDYSDGALTTRGGDLGWFLRRGEAADEPLGVATWPFEGPTRRRRGLQALREPLTREAGPIISGIETPRRVRVEGLDEPLVAAAWGLKAGEFTKPIQSARGWHILKVTDREGPYFTFLGARAIVRNALVRRWTEGLLERLRAAAKIEIYLQSQ
jgi:parvulin-like peptidyl-prolyl isomerase